MSIILGVEEEVPATTDLKSVALKRLLNKATAQRKLVLVIDSLDQLSDANHGRAVNRWLPLRLNPFCKIIVSTVHDTSEIAFPAVRKLLWGQVNFQQSFYQVIVLSFFNCSIHPAYRSCV